MLYRRRLAYFLIVIGALAEVWDSDICVFVSILSGGLHCPLHCTSSNRILRVASISNNFLSLMRYGVAPYGQGRGAGL
ncbi:protein of unknown function [Magnetospirillum sp. XM-1]|nr:protein of unknown function [Magnetospirillum sp. XM-1]